MKFLVTRMDALVDSNRVLRRINNSEMWPTVVNADTHEDAVAEVYRMHFGPEQRLPLDREFLVVAMIDCAVVKYRRRQDFDVVSRPY